MSACPSTPSNLTGIDGTVRVSSTADVALVDVIIQSVGCDPRYVIGKGKLDDLLLRSMQQVAGGDF